MYGGKRVTYDDLEKALAGVVLETGEDVSVIANIGDKLPGDVKITCLPSDFSDSGYEFEISYEEDPDNVVVGTFSLFEAVQTFIEETESNMYELNDDYVSIPEDAWLKLSK